MDDALPELSRISKLFVDRDQASTEAALARRQAFAVTLLCGDDVADCAILQLAVLTATRIAARCFPGAVKVSISPQLAEAPLLAGPSNKLRFGEALFQLVGPAVGIDAESRTAHGLIFGNALSVKGALRVTFDGWIAKVGPATTMSRLPERPYCSLAGVLAASLAISELFLAFAELSIEATRRIVGLSLWRPDLDIDHPEALGVPVEYLPRELWLLGLGHLGNAYLWALATLPYKETTNVSFYLCDFDKVELENVETGVLFTTSDVRHLKTRVCSAWLERLGFQTRLVERRFDATFRRHEKEPALALCGFDSNPARRDLFTAQFLRVIESGLGGTAANFDTMKLNTLPSLRAPEDLWPDLSADEQVMRAKHQDHVARNNSGYAQLGKDECGRLELAGKSVAVPFVGVTAACLVVAEALRLAHGGPAFRSIKLSLATPAVRVASMDGLYPDEALAGLAFAEAKT